MNKLKLLLAIVIAPMLIGCGQQNPPPVTKVHEPKKDRVQAAFAHSDFSDLRNVVYSSMLELDNMSKANRGDLFKLLASGDVDTIESRLDSNAQLFFEAVRFIEGNHDSYPTYERINELYSYWEESGGDFDIFLTMWSQPAIEGFQLSWVRDLPDITENGRTKKGWRIRNTGTVAWPNSLGLEPLMVAPQGGIVIETLPKAVKVPGNGNDVVSPGEMVDIYVDVTGVTLTEVTSANLYFISTFEDEKKHRRNVWPRPMAALGKFPNLLYLTVTT